LVVLALARQGALAWLVDFKTDDELRALARAEHEDALNDDFGNSLGEDWRNDAYATAKEQLVSGAFVEPDDVFGLVAHGSVKDERCGSFMKRKTKHLIGCLNLHGHEGVVGLDGFNYTGKAFVQRVFNSCDRPECPSCAISGWATKLARRVEANLKYAAEELGYDEIFHIIVSFPKNCNMSFDAKKRYAIDYMRSVNIVGGCWLYHHYRYHRANETYEGEPARYLKDNPHFHVLGMIRGGLGNCRSCAKFRDGDFGHCREHCNGFEAVVRRAYDKAVDDGRVPLIIKVKDKRKTIGGTLWYELSHASYVKSAKKKVVLNYFGVMARNKLKIPKGRLSYKKPECPICKIPLQKIVYLGNYKDMLSFLAVKDEKNKGVWFDLVDGHGSLMFRLAKEVNNG
jgi:hypothetical protein